MSFVFLHTSDLHIGKPFAGFDTEKAVLLREFRLTAINRLAEEARSAAARHIVMAGDTFDRDGLADEVIRKTLARFAAHDGLVWHVIPGNHDADRPAGIWERAIRIGLPVNVRLHREAAPVEMAPGVYLLPSPLRARAVTADPTLWMESAPTPAGAARIGLAHGSTQGFGSDASAAVLIDPTRRNRAGLAYLALGDWHGTKEVGDGVWYSGTPEPDQFADNDPGGALVVRIDGATVSDVRRVATATCRWARRAITCRTVEDIAPLIRELDRIGPAAEQLLLDLTIDGTLTLAARAALDDVLAGIAARIMVLRTRLDGLRTLPDDGDLARLEDHQLRAAAERLARKAEDAEDPEKSAAVDALRELYTLAAAAREATP